MIRKNYINVDEIFHLNSKIKQKLINAKLLIRALFRKMIQNIIFNKKYLNNVHYQKKLKISKQLNQ